ncbi:MAG: sigma-54-dependent transcriptional regulator [Fibrobacterota bacterium]
MRESVLIVDDDAGIRAMLNMALKKKQKYDLHFAENAEDGIMMLRKEKVDCVVTDYKMPGMNGLEFFKKAREEENSEVPFIFLTAFGTIETAVDAMRSGASDFIEKHFPDKLSELESRIESCIEFSRLKKENRELKNENVQLKEQLSRNFKYVSGDPAMKSIEDMVDKVSQARSTILITGQSGTGKEVIAKMIHHRSPRQGLPFVKVNCAALPEGLIESELFGHEKGAFTGALRKTRGKFELANGGTLLLDEIGEMPITMQAKLLRVLQEREINKIGSESPIQVDVRLIATTNRDLRKEIEDGNFREDLFYRLNVVSIKLPPLKDRKKDIIPLAGFFLERFNEENGYLIKDISTGALKVLEDYDWPGNVRELENAIERAAVLAASDSLEAEDFDLNKTRVIRGGEGALGSGICAGMTVAEMEKELILKTLQEHGNNKTRAAEVLDISIRTLRNKLNEYRSNGAPNIPD